MPTGNISLCRPVSFFAGITAASSLLLCTTVSPVHAQTTTQVAGQESAAQNKDHGLPITQIAQDLGVTPEQFRTALEKVRANTAGQKPTEAQRTADRKALADALGVSTDRLDAVMSKYRPGKPGNKGATSQAPGSQKGDTTHPKPAGDSRPPDAPASSDSTGSSGTAPKQDTTTSKPRHSPGSPARPAGHGRGTSSRGRH